MMWFPAHLTDEVFKSVLSHMRCLSHYFQVGRVIICPKTILVMHNFCRKKSPTNKLLCNLSMFVNPFILGIIPPTWVSLHVSHVSLFRYRAWIQILPSSSLAHLGHYLHINCRSCFRRSAAAVDTAPARRPPKLRIPPSGQGIGGVACRCEASQASSPSPPASRRDWYEPSRPVSSRPTSTSLSSVVTRWPCPMRISRRIARRPGARPSCSAM